MFFVARTTKAQQMGGGAMRRSFADSFDTLSALSTRSGRVEMFRLSRLADQGVKTLSRMPLSIKVLLEALLRSENGSEVTRSQVLDLACYDARHPKEAEVPFVPARVLLQDFTGVPCLVDLAAMRSAMARLGGDPRRISPQVPVDLVIDHSIRVDAYGTSDALSRNVEMEYERNRERYRFLRWGQQAFDRLRVIPPSSGICHQVNLERLATVVRRERVDGKTVALPDSLVGTDSHTPTINGAGVLGWGVGGIEAEAAMLGQPIFIVAPPVVGVELVGELRPGVTATDLVLTVTEELRRREVVGKFVEFFGRGLSSMAIPDRSTVANMAPEYGATVGFFPVDDRTLEYLRQTGRPEDLIDLVERYCKEQGMFRSEQDQPPDFNETVRLDLTEVEPCVAGPSRPQDRISLARMKDAWREMLEKDRSQSGFGVRAEKRSQRFSISIPASRSREAGAPEAGAQEVTHGAVAIAAITSCTNTSNPAVMLGAGLLAKKAAEAGLSTKPWVKTSLAPGSRVVTEYLERAGLLGCLEKLGFHVVGYGCTTCIGNSGPVLASIAEAVEGEGMVAAAVVSGNRNFEGRISPHVKASFLASPLLVVAYALAGTVDIDFETEPLGEAETGPVYLKDVWPSNAELADMLPLANDPESFRQSYAGLEEAGGAWRGLAVEGSLLYPWPKESTYIREPPFFIDMEAEPEPIRPIEGARVLVYVGDSVTTDHISPAGDIPPESPAGLYLMANSVPPDQLNTFGSRRGNDEVMTRGTFSNIRLRNELAPETEGGWTTHFPSGEVVSVFEASRRYEKKDTPTIVLAGRDYGMGSSRDWAAKGTLLLGVKAVIARSFERIHRSNLIGMGVLPLQLMDGRSAESLGLTGSERYRIDIDDDLQPGQSVPIEVVGENGEARTFSATCRLDSESELEYFRNGGILEAVLRRLLREETERESGLDGPTL
jgi:aconitate hydratase